MQSSQVQDVLSSAAERSACGGKDVNLLGSVPTSEKGRTLTAFRKIRFSARRALQMVSRSLDNRAGLRTGSDLSDGDVLCKAQASQVISPDLASPVVEHQSSRNHFIIHHAMSFRFSKLSVSTDASMDSPRLVDDKSWQPQPTFSLQTPQLQQEPTPHQSPTAPPPSKQRSLLSALFKCQSPGTSANTDTAKAVPVPAPSVPSQKPGGSSSPPAVTSETSRESTWLKCHLLQPGLPSTIRQQACSLDRLYDSLPAQQDRRNPAPYPMLVPRRPSPSVAANRIDLCLSAPSPHMKSERHGLHKPEPDDTTAARMIPPSPPPPPSVSLAAAQAGASTNTTTSSDDIPAPPTVSVQLAEAMKQHATSSSRALGPLPVPLITLATEGATKGETSSSSVPATSILASSLGRGGLPGLAPGCPAIGQRPNVPTPPVLAAQAASEHSSSKAGGPSMLLAMSRKVPTAMLRNVWALEHYSLQKRLYKGAMSSVYKGRCLCSGMQVALKVYFKHRVPANVVHMVMREVRIHLQASEHRNVLKLYGVFQVRNSRDGSPGKGTQALRDPDSFIQPAERRHHCTGDGVSTPRQLVEHLPECQRREAERAASSANGPGAFAGCSVVLARPGCLPQGHQAREPPLHSRLGLSAG
ncbi:hypothetical protein Vretimale_952 [Volvox reticuliferus]|uniref:Aurora kinase n=1 Tax=Volvox reticuliferus TaxID=1737510 RepID=A0A8J4D6R0_9CHLO|nr:hypothetical protein Vretifemale_10489 [Volvox reticuliferus]GIL94824.1 hypothetical protein Vretimale_952 [Volvox reticuliferus]